MSIKLGTGPYRISSLVDKSNLPVGIDDTERTRPGESEPVRVAAAIEKWDLEEVGENKFLLRIAGLNSHVIGDKVRVSNALPPPGQKWRAIYRELQGAFSIVLDDKQEKGWTVPSDRPSVIGAEIGIEVIKETSSEPPQYALSQLFRLVPLNE